MDALTAEEALARYRVLILRRGALRRGFPTRPAPIGGQLGWCDECGRPADCEEHLGKLCGNVHGDGCSGTIREA